MLRSKEGRRCVCLPKTAAEPLKCIPHWFLLLWYKPGWQCLFRFIAWLDFILNQIKLLRRRWMCMCTHVLRAAFVCSLLGLVPAFASHLSQPDSDRICCVWALFSKRFNLPSVITWLCRRLYSLCGHILAAQWKNVVIWLEFWWFFHFSLLTVWQSQIISWNPVGKRVLCIWPNLILSSRWHTCASQRMFMFDLCVNWISWGFEMSKIVFSAFLTLYKL